MTTLRLLSLRSLRLLLVPIGIMILAHEFRGAFGQKAVISATVAILFLAIANYSMSWAVNSHLMGSLDQKQRARQSSRDLLQGALWTAIGTIDLATTLHSDSKIIIGLHFLVQLVSYTAGIAWGMLGIDMLLKMSIAEHQFTHSNPDS